MNEEDTKQTSFVGHLTELRSRLVKSIVYLFIFFSIIGKSLGPIINIAKTTMISISNHPICGILNYFLSKFESSLELSCDVVESFWSEVGSFIPFLKLLIPLATSPIKADIFPLPKRRTTSTTTIAICLKPILITNVYTIF